MNHRESAEVESNVASEDRIDLPERLLVAESHEGVPPCTSSHASKAADGFSSPFLPSTFETVPEHLHRRGLNPVLQLSRCSRKFVHESDEMLLRSVA
jgi:hypothetical protein